MNVFLILFGKSLSLFSKVFNLGSGSTWPGHIALSLNKHFVKEIVSKSDIKIILVAGTNGKTTTSAMITAILEKNGNRVIHNITGANLLNGIASTLILKASIFGSVRADYAIFEVDENALPLILLELTPDYLVLLNLFRDQLDRYGEVHTIAEKWEKALKKLPKETTVVLNADDPEIANLGNKTTATTIYFGLSTKTADREKEHAADSTYCPNCTHELTYKTLYFSHLGDWKCQKCGLRRPELTVDASPGYPLAGTYNKYNTHAAVTVAKQISIPETEIESALKDFRPAFGRQEILAVDGKKIQIFLSKNPTGFNESLRTIKELHAKTILFVLNDRIADGRDVSWIWDVDMNILLSIVQHIYVSGDRSYDMALRIKYEGFSEKLTVLPILADAMQESLSHIAKDETLYILPTYTAMLDVRKILTGKKIIH